MNTPKQNDEAKVAEYLAHLRHHTQQAMETPSGTETPMPAMSDPLNPTPNAILRYLIDQSVSWCDAKRPKVPTEGGVGEFFKSLLKRPAPAGSIPELPQLLPPAIETLAATSPRGLAALIQFGVDGLAFKQIASQLGISPENAATEANAAAVTLERGLRFIPVMQIDAYVDLLRQITYDEMFRSGDAKRSKAVSDVLFSVCRGQLNRGEDGQFMTLALFHLSVQNKLKDYARKRKCDSAR